MLVAGLFEQGKGPGEAFGVFRHGKAQLNELRGCLVEAFAAGLFEEPAGGFAIPAPAHALGKAARQAVHGGGIAPLHAKGKELAGPRGIPGHAPAGKTERRKGGAGLVGTVVYGLLEPFGRLGGVGLLAVHALEAEEAEGGLGIGVALHRPGLQAGCLAGPPERQVL